MRLRPLSIAALGVGFFLGSLALGVAVPSCTGDPAMGVQDSAPYVNPTAACSNGVIQILSCTSAGGAPAESFSDEACRSYDDAELRGLVVHNDARAPTIELPTEGQSLAGDAPFTFTWRAGTLAQSAPPARALEPRWTLGIELIASAEAHCPPFNGVGYVAVFRSGAREVLRAETASLRYQPNAAAWARLRAAGGALELRVAAARFDNSAVTVGPFDQTTPRRFTINP